jgi:hypothetical protein
MEIPARYQVECGMVTVPEDHSNPDGPAIQLAVAIVRNSGDTSVPDPLLFINGGPGARTLDSISLWLEPLSLGPLLAQRDVIALDPQFAKGVQSQHLGSPLFRWSGLYHPD